MSGVLLDRSNWTEYDVIEAINNLPHPPSEQVIRIAEAIHTGSEHLCLRVAPDNVWDDVIANPIAVQGVPLSGNHYFYCLSCYKPIAHSGVLLEFRRIVDMSECESTGEIAVGQKFYHMTCMPDIRRCDHVSNGKMCGKLCEFDCKLLKTLLRDYDQYLQGVKNAEEELYSAIPFDEIDNFTFGSSVSI